MSDDDRPMTIDEVNVAIGELVEKGLVRHARDDNGDLHFRNGHAVWEAVPLSDMTEEDEARLRRMLDE